MSVDRGPAGRVGEDRDPNGRRLQASVGLPTRADPALPDAPKTL